MSLHIGDVEFSTPVFLAPMAGVTDYVYRKICHEQGSGGSTTELISAKAVLYKNKNTGPLLYTEGDEGNVGLQLFGSSPEIMGDIAKELEDRQFAFVDINMGCPVPKVAVSAQAGAALLKNPDKVYEIVKSVVEAVSIPVTVKIRSGWDKNSINAIEIAKVCERAGASAICVHPRTRSQRYEGLSDWNIIKEVKESISIPVIGNGDIRSVDDAKRMIELTNCDAVMIGRGVLGNPWLIRDIVNYLEDGALPKVISKDEKIDMCIKHMNYLLSFKDEKTAVLEMRSHIAWYLKGLDGVNEVKREIFKATTEKDVLEILTKFKNK